MRSFRQRTIQVTRTALALAALLSGCAATPPPAPLEPEKTLADFDARGLEGVARLPAPSSGWDRAQWLTAALALNPQLAQERAEVDAVAAGERTAAQTPNPNMELFAEYLKTAAQSPAWLYGVSLEFLLRRPGERARVRRQAALETALAQSALSDSIWEVRSGLRQALLEQVSTREEEQLLEQLRGERQQLLDADTARLKAGDVARAQVLTDQVELARVAQRLEQARAREADARAHLAAEVGVPVGALQGAGVRWEEWSRIDALAIEAPERYRHEALIGRSQIVSALREYDLAELHLQGEIAQRWPQLRIQPAYAWGGEGVREDALDAIASESALGVSFEVPVFNQHQGQIAEALGRRTAAGAHLKAVQAAVYAQIDRAQLAWPTARSSWQQMRQLADLADEQRRAEERALRAGASDRGALLAADIAATEARLALLESAFAAQQAFGALEDAFRRPLDGTERNWTPDGGPRA
ncbi:MAG: TolC family protein [Proteobacteria bacterium]|nr:TolC family protein [Pseudomonadota bacterium]